VVRNKSVKKIRENEVSKSVCDVPGPACDKPNFM
jgi:hypothetical protein